MVRWNRNAPALGFANTLPDVANRTQPKADPEIEGRARLVYWVRRRMRDVGIRSVRQLAKITGIPESNAARWLGKGGTGGIPLLWLAELCRVLRVDPVWFTMLPAIPDDPLAPYTLPEDDPLLVAIAAARLGRRDQAEAAVSGQPAAAQRRARPRKRAVRVLR